MRDVDSVNRRVLFGGPLSIHPSFCHTKVQNYYLVTFN